MARKIPVKLILELRDAGLSMRKIAASRHISRHSVSDVFRIAGEKGIAYRDVRDMKNGELYQLFFPERHFIEALFEQPNYEKVHQELKKTGVTLKLLLSALRGGFCFSSVYGILFPEARAMIRRVFSPADTSRAR